MRPVMKMDALPAHPHLCIICGLGPGNNDRKFFVDLGFDIDVHYQPLHSGAVYLCDQCGKSVFDALDLIFAEDYRLTNEQLGEYSEPTYNQFDEFGGTGEDTSVSSEQASEGPEGTESSGSSGENSGGEVQERVPEIWDELSGDSVQSHSLPPDESRPESQSPHGIPDNSLRSAESLGVTEPTDVSDSTTDNDVEDSVQFTFGIVDSTGNS